VVIERPILFSAPMVRAILAGTKTQTRRAVRVDDRPVIVKMGSATERCERQRGIPSNATNVRYIGPYLKCDAPEGSNTVSSRVRCPFGVPCDRLWVRETWAVPPGIESRDAVAYRADIPPDAESDERWARRNMQAVAVWRPSIHMPRWASRLTLEIEAVRVERVREITEADVRAEGLASHPSADGTLNWWVAAGGAWLGPRRAFEALWDSINTDENTNWSANPWVWVVTFRLLP
jgi:hypothetical protein